MARPAPDRAQLTYCVRLFITIAVSVGLGNNRAAAQSVSNLLLIVNSASATSEAVAHRYVTRRGVPQDNICSIHAPVTETVSRAVYESEIERPIWKCIAAAAGQDRILYLVLTKDTPIRIAGTGGRAGTVASVDSELAVLYRRRAGVDVPVMGFVPNPYFAGGAAPAAIKPFTHDAYDIYLVTRLDGYTQHDVEELIDRGSAPTSDGRFVLDERASLVDSGGDAWLRAAAERLRAQGLGERVVLDETTKILTSLPKVLGYYSWGSNDPAFKQRHYQFEFVPGALAASFVSTDARTFKEPPYEWNPSNNATKAAIYAGSHQSLIADLIRDGATGVAGHVNEPYLDGTIRPDILFPAYVAGRNLAEAFYAAMPYLSWQTVVIGDPLCAPFQRSPRSSQELDPGFDFQAELPAMFAKRLVTALPGSVKRESALAYARYQSRANRGDMAGAREALEAAVIADPVFALARRDLATWQDSEGQTDRAIANYEAIVKYQPNDATALNNLAFALATKKGQPDKALVYAERAAAIDRTNAAVLDTLAWVQHLSGHDRAALVTMEHLLTLGTVSGEILWHSAAIFASVKDLGRAGAALNAALKLNPALADRDEVKKLQEQLPAAAKQ